MDLLGAERRAVLLRDTARALRDTATLSWSRFGVASQRSSVIDASTLGQIYAARWVVELFFRELKSHFRVEDLPSRKRHIVEALLYVAIVAFVVSRHLLAAVRRELGADAALVPEERWAILFARCGRDLLRLMLWPPRDAAPLARRLEPFLLHAAVAPDHARAPLLARVESRTQYFYRATIGAHA